VPEDLDEPAGAPAEDVEIARVRIALQLLRIPTMPPSYSEMISPAVPI
jgi:hypothetical protein